MYVSIKAYNFNVTVGVFQKRVRVLKIWVNWQHSLLFAFIRQFQFDNIRRVRKLQQTKVIKQNLNQLQICISMYCFKWGYEPSYA